MEEVILQWNVNGYFSKIHSIHLLLHQYSPLLIALQETKLNTNNNVHLKNYNIYRKDRNENGGGVLLAVHNSCPNYRININTHLEVIACAVYFKNKKLNVASVYIPGNITFSIDDFVGVLNQMEGDKLLLGDFNAKHNLWGSKIRDKEVT